MSAGPPPKVPNANQWPSTCDGTPGVKCNTSCMEGYRKSKNGSLETTCTKTASGLAWTNVTAQCLPGKESCSYDVCTCRGARACDRMQPELPSSSSHNHVTFCNPCGPFKFFRRCPASVLCCSPVRFLPPGGLAQGALCAAMASLLQCRFPWHKLQN